MPVDITIGQYLKYRYLGWSYRRIEKEIGTSRYYLDQWRRSNRAAILRHEARRYGAGICESFKGGRMRIS